jgi:hypothetical protein
MEGSAEGDNSGADLKVGPYGNGGADLCGRL